MPRSTLELMSDHRTVRDFKPVPLDGPLLAEVVAAAQLASTSSHVQAYCVLRVTDDETRRRLAELAGGQRQVTGAGALLVVCGDIRRHQLLARRADHPHVQNLESFLVAVVDASLFAQNLALACEAKGLGICYLGSLRNQLDEVDALLGLPEGVLPLYGLAVGEPESVPDRKPRLPLDAVLFDDTYPDDARMLELVDGYEAEMADYYAERGAPGRSWSRGILAKHEAGRRAYLAGYYRRKGAVLD